MSPYHKIILSLKEKKEFSINVNRDTLPKIELKVINRSSLQDNKVIKDLALWREREAYWFGNTFNVTIAGTKKWLGDQVVENPDRILFLIKGVRKTYGHIGFNRYRAWDNSCELDNVVRGVAKLPGLMTDCVNSLCDWGFRNLHIHRMLLTTFADNERAVNLYLRCGFKKMHKIPLKKKTVDGQTVYVKLPYINRNEADRYYIRMVRSN